MDAIRAIPWGGWAVITVVLTYLWLAARTRLGIANRRHAGTELRIGNNLLQAWLVRGLTLSVVLMIVAMIWLDLGAGWAWLLSVNVATMLIFGWDKLKALVAGRRVPESTLHSFVAVGGGAGLLLGVDAFKHKKSDEKRRFRQRAWNIVLIQAVIAFLILRNRAGT